MRVLATRYVHVTSNDVRAPRRRSIGVGALVLIVDVAASSSSRILLGPAMTPGARLAAAIEVLADIERAAPAGAPMRSRTGACRTASPAPATAPAIAGLVYDALRRRASARLADGRGHAARASLLGMLSASAGSTPTRSRSSPTARPFARRR